MVVVVATVGAWVLQSSPLPKHVSVIWGDTDATGAADVGWSVFVSLNISYVYTVSAASAVSTASAA